VIVSKLPLEQPLFVVYRQSCYQDFKVKAKAKDLAVKAKDLAVKTKAKDLTVKAGNETM
jgi:hypothetical protein